MEAQKQEGGNLCLTRRCGERVQIGEDVWVEVVSVSGRAAKLRITAPMEKRIVRDELQRKL